MNIIGALKMTDDTPASNRKAADRLHDIRARIAELKAEEAAIRDGLINGTLSTEGDNYTATIDTKVNERIDLKRMRQHVAEEIWKPFLIEKEIAYVTVKKRAT